MNDFLRFRKFITPLVIQVLFWLGVIGAVITGLMMMVQGGGENVISGLGIIIFGPVVVRIYMEVLIIVFRLYDSVHHLEQALTGGALPSMPVAPMGGPSAPVSPPPSMPPAP